MDREKKINEIKQLLNIDIENNSDKEKCLDENEEFKYQEILQKKRYYEQTDLISDYSITIQILKKNNEL